MVSMIKDLREKDYAVVDDFLPEEVYHNGKLFLYSMRPRWSFLQDVSFMPDYNTINPDLHNKYGFSYVMYGEGMPVDDVEGKKELLDGLAQALDKHFVIDKIMRVKAGLQGKTLDPHAVQRPHVDLSYPHYTALFYFCTEESGYGVTTIYKEKHDPYEAPNSSNHHKHEDLTLVDSIQPKENRMLIFKGLTLHSSSAPVDTSIRIAVNLNFIGYPREESIQDEQSIRPT